jgi:putative two-component system response regulator
MSGVGLAANSRSEGRILVVDDEPAVRRVLNKLLRNRGYEVIEAASGQQALDVLEHCEVDTVLLDVMMPGLTGVEVCRRIRANPKIAHTPVVFVTAAADQRSRREAREAGADDFLSKPFDEVELRARVRNSVKTKIHNDGLANESQRLKIAVDDRTRALQQATAALERARAELDRAQRETIERLTRAAEFRDDETAAHLQRMSHYSRLLARRKGLDDYTAELIRVASPMHDVGKIGIPDSILLKPGKLTREEFEIMKQHAEIGYRILSGSDSPLLELAASIARSHHEKWNGSGYPRGLTGEDIPVEGRIVAVADVFDALTSRRPYKKAWSLADAIALLQAGRGEHFDPEIVDLFLGSIDEVLEIKSRFRDDEAIH